MVSYSQFVVASNFWSPIYDSRRAKIECLGIFPHKTERQEGTRFIGDIEIYDEVVVTYYGFENHNGVTTLGSQSSTA